MVTRKKTKPRKPKAPARLHCEVKTELGCNDQCVRRYTGRKKGDPVFYCCIGCHAILRRAGVRLKEVTE